jgi:hypothetical protein
VRRASEDYAHDDAAWRRLQPLLPAPLRLQTRYAPRERWLPVGRFTVHLDRYGDDQAPACVVLVHGAGGNGRLLACYGQMAAAAGFAAVAAASVSRSCQSSNRRIAVRTPSSPWSARARSAA